MERLTNSLNWNHQLAKKLRVNVELIFVEYNPISGQSLLSDLDIWPHSDFWQTKIIPHRDDSGSDQFEEFTAKNIGIRQATGDYILVSNADIFLPEWCFMNYQDVEKNKFLLADRLNVRNSSFDWNEMLRSADEYCMKGGIFLRPSFIPHGIYYRALSAYLRVRKTMYKVFPFLLKPGVQFLLEYHFTACGDFMLAHRSVWKELNGFREGTSETAHVDSLFLLKVISHNFEIEEIRSPVLHQNHEHRYSFRKPTREMQKMLEVLLEEIQAFQASQQPVVVSKAKLNLR